jgi:hypothetical protein
MPPKDAYTPPKFSKSAIASILMVLAFPLEIYAMSRLRQDPPMWLQGSLLTLMVATPFAAITFGIFGRREDRLSGYTKGGTGTATTAIILATGLLLVFAWVQWVMFNDPKFNGVTYDETHTSGTLRALGLALPIYKRLHPETGYPDKLDELFRDFATAREMRQFPFYWPPTIDEETTGHRFNYLPSKSQLGGSNDSFKLFVDPTRRLWHNRVHYFLDQSQILHEAINHPADGNSTLSYDLR